MKKLEKASAKYDWIGNAMDAEHQKIGGRSYDEVGRILWSLERGMNPVSTLDANAAAEIDSGNLFSYLIDLF